MIDEDGVLVRFAHLEDGEWLFKPRELRPEKKLFAAVLEDAWKCFEENVASTNIKRQLICNEARFWFGDRSTHWIFAFENVCYILDISPDPIRRQVNRIDQRACATLRQGLIPEVRDGGLPASTGRPAH